MPPPSRPASQNPHGCRPLPARRIMHVEPSRMQCRRDLHHGCQARLVESVRQPPSLTTAHRCQPRGASSRAAARCGCVRPATGHLLLPSSPDRVIAELGCDRPQPRHVAGPLRRLSAACTADLQLAAALPRAAAVPRARVSPSTHPRGAPSPQPPQPPQPSPSRGRRLSSRRPQAARRRRRSAGRASTPHRRAPRARGR